MPCCICDFGNHLNDALRDRLVCGIKSVGAHKKLLAELVLTFQKVVKIATNYEAIDENAKSMAKSESPINVYAVKGTQSVSLHNPSHEPSSPSVKDQRPCYCCGKECHGPNFCRFRNTRGTANCNESDDDMSSCHK